MTLPLSEYHPQTLDEELTAKIFADRRRHRRVELHLLGRFMRANKAEYPCQLVDISVGGASMQSPVLLEMGERVVAYFDHIGGIEGNVVRTYNGGFAMKLVATQHKREKLAAQLTWLINRAVVDGIDERRHERQAVDGKFASLKLADGSAIDCQILDISMSGASLGMSARPPIGMHVVLGKQNARIMRHHDKGIGVQFFEMQEPGALQRYFD